MAEPQSEIYVAGTGSFALEVVEYARAAGLRVAGLIELVDAARIGGTQHGLDVVGFENGSGRAFAVGLGGDRIAHATRLREHGWRAVSVISPASHISPSAGLGDGTVVAPAAVVGAAADIDEHVLIGRGALVGHHTWVGSGATVNPGANVAGNARIGAGAVIGIGAQISNGIEIGPRSLVAAGAVVVRRVEPDTRVQGVPARVVAP